MKLRVWVEVSAGQRLTEDVVEVPEEEWAAMSPEERDRYKTSVFELYEFANGGCEEIKD